MQSHKIFPKISATLTPLILGIILMLVVPFKVHTRQTINLCTDVNFWGPFTFVLFDKPAGIHVELARKALTNLGYEVNISAYPWKRCLEMSKEGSCDGILSLSYKKDRTDFLFYPSDADLVEKSKWRVTMAEYVIVVPIDSKYEWNGDDATLPQPIRLPMGYGTVDRLKAKHLKVQTSLTDKNLFAMLLRDKTGAVIAFRLSAETFLKQPAYKNHLKILPNPYATKSYFLGFSKTGKISEVSAKRIWAEIASLREDPAIMDKIVDKVNSQIEQCAQDKTQCGIKWESQ